MPDDFLVKIGKSFPASAVFIITLIETNILSKDTISAADKNVVIFACLLILVMTFFEKIVINYPEQKKEVFKLLGNWSEWKKGKFTLSILSVIIAITYLATIWYDVIIAIEGYELVPYMVLIFVNFVVPYFVSTDPVET